MKKIRNPNMLDYFYLLVLAGMLGSSFILMKISVQTVPTALTVFFRLLIALVILYGYMKIRGLTFPKEKKFFWGYSSLLGLTANIIPFSSITWAEREIDSNLASIYMATIPMFSIVLAHFLSDDEKMNGRILAGMLISVFGVVLLLWENLTEVSTGLVAQLACVFAAFFYAFSRIQTKKMSNIEPITISTGVLICAVLIMLPYVVIFENVAIVTPSTESIVSILLLGIFPTAFAYAILYKLIAEVGAVFMTSVNYLVPVFGVIWGSMVLSEEVSSNLLMSFLMIMLGLWVAKGKFFWKLNRVKLRE